MLQEKERIITEWDNIKNKIKDFLPNFDVYCDHLAIIQNHVRNVLNTNLENWS